jgi:hypothetical protein
LRKNFGCRESRYIRNIEASTQTHAADNMADVCSARAARSGWDGFRTDLFERYQRSEKALVGTLAEMYVQGVSMRKGQGGVQWVMQGRPRETHRPRFQSQSSPQTV